MALSPSINAQRAARQQPEVMTAAQGFAMGGFLSSKKRLNQNIRERFRQSCILSLTLRSRVRELLLHPDYDPAHPGVHQEQGRAELLRLTRLHKVLKALLEPSTPDSRANLGHKHRAHCLH